MKAALFLASICVVAAAPGPGPVPAAVPGTTPSPATTPPGPAPTPAPGPAPAPVGPVAPTAPKKACFARDSTVTLEGGKVVAITQVKAGDRVVAMADDGHLITTPVLRRTYDELVAPHSFLRFKTTSGAAIEVTAKHFMFANACCHFHSDVAPKFADEVTVGETIFVANSATGKVEGEKIVSIETVQKTGAINVHTLTGTIIVNNVAATHFTAETTFGAAGRAYLAPVWYAFLHYVVRPTGFGASFGL